MVSMDPDIIIAEIERYRAATGLKVSTICQRAFGNARYLDRLNARIARLPDELQRLHSFIEKNPPPPSASHDGTSADRRGRGIRDAAPQQPAGNGKAAASNGTGAA